MKLKNVDKIQEELGVDKDVEENSMESDDVN